jgi:hypothetical protein
MDLSIALRRDMGEDAGIFPDAGLRHCAKEVDTGLQFKDGTLAVTTARSNTSRDVEVTVVNLLRTLKS